MFLLANQYIICTNEWWEEGGKKKGFYLDVSIKLLTLFVSSLRTTF